MTNIREIQLNDGKYTVRFNPEKYNGNGGFEQPYRYGEPWPAFDGREPPMNNLECALARRVMELEDELAALKAETN